MSIKHMSYAWDNAPYSGVRLLTLLALADSADKDTGHCFPSAKGLAQRARLKSTRHVYEHLEALERDGWISRERHPGRRTHYVIHMPSELSTTSDSSVTSDFPSVVTLASPRSDPSVTPPLTLESPPNPVTVTKPLLNQESARTRTRIHAHTRAYTRIHAHARETLFPDPPEPPALPAQTSKPSPAADAAWRDVRSRLRASHALSDGEYATWIAPLRAGALDTTGITLTAPGADHARMVTQRYAGLIAALVADRMGQSGQATARVTILSVPSQASKASKERAVNA